MTERTVEISITVKIKDKKIEREIKAEVNCLDEEIKKAMDEIMKEVMVSALEVIDDEIREREAKEWKNLGREKHRIKTMVGEIEIKRRVYRDEEGRRRKPLDEAMGIGRYQRETGRVRAMGAWLAIKNSYREAAEELSYMVKEKYTHSKIQRMVWEIGNKLADEEEAEIRRWDGAEGDEEKIKTAILYGESDGVMIRLQREKKRKAEVRVGIMYTGKTVTGVGRKRLENKVYMTKIGVSNEEWQQTIQKTADKNYDLENVKYFVSGGDGNSWVKKSFNYVWVANRAHILDKFHLNRASRAALGFNWKTAQILKQIYKNGLEEVADELEQIKEKSRGKKRKAITKYIRYLESNRDSLKDVEIEGHKCSLGAIEGNVDKLVAKRLKGNGRSWRIRGARAMITLCRYKSQLRDLAMSFTSLDETSRHPRRRKKQTDGNWLQCSLPIFSSGDQSKPWVKELRRNLKNRGVLSMEYL